ncbi:unnamed protein product [Auanema sp. JU1783]|nr:unnamed protein product [Auanema sp. JU1783]
MDNPKPEEPGEIHIPSMNDADSIPIGGTDPPKETTPESPGSRSNYGEFFWDTNGENDYHMSLLDDDFFMDSRGATAARLDRTQSDLNKFKQRIDNNVEQQREYSEMMANLQTKVHDYRRHLAQMEKKLAGESIRLPDKPLVTNINSDVIDSNTTYIRDVEIWSPSRTLHTVSAGLGGDSNANYEIRARLDDEIKRGEEFRMQWEHERSVRDQLELENERLRSEFDRFEQEFRDKEQSYIHKNKNLTQYLSDEQQKMMDLWTDLQKVRKQFASLKQQTESDLEDQKVEIRHMIQNISNAAGFDNAKRIAYGENINSSTNIDINVMEMLRGLSRGNNSQDKEFLLEHLKKITNVSDSEEITAEMYNGLVSRYENTINNNLELQKKLEELESKNNEQASSLRKKEEQLSEAHRGLHRVLKLARRSDDRGLRTRSVSPVPDTVPATESINAVRQALRTRDHEIRRAAEKSAQQQTQLSELENKLKASEEARKRMDKQIEDARRELTNNHKSIQEMDRARSRLEDRINAAQRDVEAAEKARLLAQSEVQKLRNLMQETDSNNKTELANQLEMLSSKMDEDFKENLANILRQNEVLSSENSKLRIEKRALEEKQAEYSESNTDLRNELQTQNMKLENLKSSLDKLESDLRNCQQELEQKSSALRNLQSERENNMKTIQKQDFKLQEITQQRDQLLKDKTGIKEKITILENKYSTTLKNKEDHERTLDNLRSELNDALERLKERDAQFLHLNEVNDNLDTAKRTYEGKIAQLEIDVSSRNSEIDKLVELNHKLQDERKDILNQKLESDNKIENMKEATRKLEQELHKTTIEIKKYESQSDQNSSIVAELENEISKLQREIAELRDENKELTDQINDLQERIRQKRGATGRKDKGGRSDTTTSTTTTTIIHGDRTKDSGDEIYIPSHTPEHMKHEDDGKYDDGSDVRFSEDHLIMDVKLRELNDHWRQQVEDIEKKNEDLMKKRNESDQEVQTLLNEINSLKNEIKDKEVSHEQQIAEMQRELKRLSERHIFENNIEKEEAQESINQRDRTISELRQKIEKLQEALNDAENKVQAFESDRIENELRINEFVDKINNLKSELEESRSSSEKEIQKWKKEAYQSSTDNKVLEGSNMALKAELDSTISKLNLLDKNNKEDNVKLRDNIGTIRQLTEQLSGIKDENQKKDDSISSLTAKAQDLKHQLDILTEQSSKWKYDAEYNQRTVDNLEKIKTDLENDLENSKNKEKSLSEKVRELKLVKEQDRTDKENLKRGFREKNQRLEEIIKANNKLKSELEDTQTKLRELNNKMISADSDRQSLERNLEKAVKELEFCSSQLKRKTDEYQTALGDLAHNQRVSEDGRLNAIQELESKKYENDDLKQRLSNMEQRMLNLQQEFVKVDSERDALTEEFARFHSSIRNMFNSRVRFDTKIVNRGLASPKHRTDGTAQMDSTIGQRDTTNQIDIPFNNPATGDFSVKTQFEVTSIVSSINDILDKVRELERERSNLTDELQHLRKKLDSNRSSTTKTDKTYRTIELNLNDVEDEKRGLQSSVDSLKEIIRNQEEAFKDRDEKRRKMKVAMAAMELEAKEKDAQIRHLKDSVKTLKTKLDDSIVESQNLKGKQIEYDANQFDNETRLRELERDALKYEATIAANENEKQITQNLMTELKIELGNSEHKLEKIQEEVNYQKAEIQRLEKNEMELKSLNERTSKSAHEHQLLKDQFTSLQNDYNNIIVVKQGLETQLNESKAELRSMKQRASDYQARISELQRQVHDLNIDKHRLEERFVLIDKTNGQFLQKENSLKQLLETVRNEKKLLEKEIDEMKRRFSQLEMEKRLNTTNMENATKEKQLLLKKIHMLELEKRNTDAAIKETALQREAIEKSLNAMERENKELYRNCAQLQQQIAQLEMENGNRILALTNKQRQEQEMLLMRIQEEKHQIEKVIDNKERTYKNRIKQLEQQILILREQIDTERRRKRDFGDKMLMGGLGPVSTSRTVLRSSYRDTTPSFGRNFSSLLPSTYVSNPLSPTSGLPTTTQTHERVTTSTHDDGGCTNFNQ